MKMTVSYKEYDEKKKAFFTKHGDFIVSTSPMDEYSRYYKTYSFEDGHQWNECYSTEYIEYTTEVRCCTIKATAKMFRTEFYSTESSSFYMYQPY